LPLNPIGIDTSQPLDDAAAARRTRAGAAVLGGATLLTRPDLALLNASGTEDVLGGALDLGAGDGLCLEIVARAVDTQADAVATCRKRLVAADLSRSTHEAGYGGKVNTGRHAWGARQAWTTGRRSPIVDFPSTSRVWPTAFEPGPEP
jgi:hypothetical protein